MPPGQTAYDGAHSPARASQAAVLSNSVSSRPAVRFHFAWSVAPKLLAPVGILLLLAALIVPRLPLFPSGLGIGRLSLSGAHALCASALGRFAVAVSSSAGGQCSAVAAGSALGWLALLAGVGLLAVAAYRTLAAPANHPAPPA